MDDKSTRRTARRHRHKKSKSQPSSQPKSQPKSHKQVQSLDPRRNRGIRRRARKDKYRERPKMASQEPGPPLNHDRATDPYADRIEDGVPSREETLSQDDGSEDDDISDGEYREILTNMDPQMEEHVTPNGDRLSSGSEEGEVAEETSQCKEEAAPCDDPSSTDRDLVELKQNEQEYIITMDGPSEMRNRGQALKDLTPESLNKQLRYFHVGKLPNEIDLNLLAKCLACGGMQHDSDTCPMLKCSNCGAFNEHLTVRCPTKSSKCLKCREDGHTESSCPYKLKQIHWDEITCDLCQLQGHVESDCELMWRTSGKSWVALDRAQVFLSCYECGNQGHLGNECGIRRPGKGLGSSSWTMQKIFDTPLHSDGRPSYYQPPRPKHPMKAMKGAEIKIKGSASNQIPLPDRDAFLHPKGPPQQSIKRAKKNMVIHVNPGAATRLEATPPLPSRPTLPKHPFRRQGLTQSNLERYSAGRQYDQTDSGTRDEAAFVRYNHGNPMQEYERQRDRSRSPQRRDFNRDSPRNRYQPAPYPPGGPPRRDSYIPMPSSARDAFRRHRM